MGGSGTIDETVTYKYKPISMKTKRFRKLPIQKLKKQDGEMRKSSSNRIGCYLVAIRKIDHFERRRFYFISFTKAFGTPAVLRARHYGDCSAPLLGSRPRDNTRNASGALLAKLSLFQIIITSSSSSSAGKKIGS